MKYGEITKRILDYVEVANGLHPHISRGYTSYPNWTELNNEYRDISGGSNSFSHHLPNLRNENTERPCGRYLKKIDAFPAKHKGKYMLLYRKVHPRLKGLRKLCVSILKTFRQIKGDGTDSGNWKRVNKDRARVVDHIRACRGDYNYPITKDNLIEYNNLYRKYERA
jgi:hypothetical protein